MDPGFVSFEKLQEVGVSPYLCFIPILSVFPCFGWFEAVRGRLIGPKNGTEVLEFLRADLAIWALLRTAMGSFVIIY